MNMQNDDIHGHERDDCRAVEVLTSGQTGNVIGFCLGGGRPGPNLLVSGYDPMIDDLFDKLIEIPTLPWMWGKLYLVKLDALDNEFQGNPLNALNDVIFDDSLILPPFDGAMDTPATLTDGFRTVMRACTGMGMIAGRGVALDH